MTTNTASELEKLFRERLDYFERMFEAGSIKELVDNFYTDDAVVEGYNMSPQVGKAAITAAFSGARDAGLSKIKVEADCPAAPSAGLTYQFITNDNNFAHGIEVHRAILVWRHTVDGWKCEVDFFCPR